MKPKKLKKLELKSTEIVNLNDAEMFRVQGGSSYACITEVVIDYTYNTGIGNSWWTCPPPPPGPYDNYSDRFINGSCYLPTAHIYSY